jgi:geranylgeranyl diphosphate synthase, type II
MSADFKAFSSQCRERVDAALDRLLPANSGLSLNEAMRYAVLNGGKRVRPILVFAGAHAVGDTPPAALDTLACALECIHAYSLVHDDLPAMDDDDLRRGKPTCHIAYGEANAILAGDALQTLAFQLLAELDGVSPEIRIALLGQLTRASGAEGMVLGQAIDLDAVDKQLDLAQLEYMHRHKTGALIRASVATGAILAGASEAQLQALDAYADAIGLAFQVQDDILDVTTDTATLGKQQGADMARNKPTYVSLLGLDGARAKVGELHQQALTALDGFDQRARWLRELAGYIVSRGN